LRGLPFRFHIVASFAGDGFYSPNNDSQTFTITKEWSSRTIPATRETRAMPGSGPWSPSSASRLLKIGRREGVPPPNSNLVLVAARS
jgi:hypothetical protein